MTLRASTVKILGMIAAVAIASSTGAAADSSAQAVADETKKAAQELAAKFAGAAPAEPQETPMTTGSIDEAETPPMLAALSQSARAAGEHAFDYETFARQEEEAEPAKARPAKASKRKIAKRRKRDRNGADAYRQARVAPPMPQTAEAAKKLEDDEPSLLAKIFTPSEWSLSGGDNDVAATTATPPPAPAPAFTDNEPTAADTTRSALQP